MSNSATYKESVLEKKKIIQKVVIHRICFISLDTVKCYLRVFCPRLS